MLRKMVFLTLLFAARPLAAQQPVFQDSLLDHLVGSWELKGMMAGRPAVHRVSAEWTLGHQYLHIHEKSADYEANIYIGWDPDTKSYAAFWLDVFGFSFDNTIGYAKRNGNEIPFRFDYKSGPFNNTFAYDPASDTWQWRMDNVNPDGTTKPFGRVTLTRRK